MTIKTEHIYRNILLIEKFGTNTVDMVRSAVTEGKLCVCDFYVYDSEKWITKGSNEICNDDVLIIDHHIPLEAMMSRNVTSTALACDYVRKHGPLPADHAVLINHADADSVLSSLIMTGHLKPVQKFINASVAADHTGDENELADLLQAMDDHKIRNLGSVIENLNAFLSGSSHVESDVKEMVEERKGTRNEIHDFCHTGAFRWNDDIAYIELEKDIDAGLAVPFLKEAKAIVIASPMKAGSPRPWKIRVRLGLKTEGVDLSSMGLPHLGGRWNGGSTGRNGGTDIPVEEYVKKLKEKLHR